MDINRFNIRVYGVLLNTANEVLLVHEKMNGYAFTKFPGGGLEFGEGIKDCLIREFKEETGIDIEPGAHLYTTDFFQQSAFIKTDQLISVYYMVNSGSCDTISLELQKIPNDKGEDEMRFFWVSLEQLNAEMLTFPIDKIVCGLITAQN